MSTSEQEPDILRGVSETEARPAEERASVELEGDWRREAEDYYSAETEDESEWQARYEDERPLLPGAEPRATRRKRMKKALRKLRQRAPKNEKGPKITKDGQEQPRPDDREPKFTRQIDEEARFEAQDR